MTGDREKTRNAAGAEEALDAVLRALTSVETPTNLRARVLAALFEPATTRAWATPARLAWAGATAAVLLAGYLAWPRPGTPIAVPRPPAAAAVQPSRPEVATVPSIEQEPGAGPGAGRASAPVPRAARVRRSFPFPPYRFVTARVVAPLEKPSPVVIEPLAEPQVAIEPLDIEPLSFTPVTIDPLATGR
jgi:hypothetical protein